MSELPGVFANIPASNSKLRSAAEKVTEDIKLKGDNTKDLLTIIFWTDHLEWRVNNYKGNGGQQSAADFPSAALGTTIPSPSDTSTTGSFTLEVKSQVATLICLNGNNTAMKYVGDIVGPLNDGSYPGTWTKST